MFVTVGALSSLSENTTVNLNTTSDDDVETKLLSPVVTINLFGAYGNQLSYTSDEPLLIEIPIVSNGNKGGCTHRGPLNGN